MKLTKRILLVAGIGLFLNPLSLYAEPKPITSNAVGSKLDALLQKHIHIKNGYMAKAWINNETHKIDLFYDIENKKELNDFYVQSAKVSIDLAKHFKFTVRELWDASMVTDVPPHVEIVVGKKK